jgi:hypothetical protein
MAALPPFAEVVADMDGRNALGSCGSCLCAHGEKLACEFRSFHYVRGNRFGYRRGPFLGARR